MVLINKKIALLLLTLLMTIIFVVPVAAGDKPIIFVNGSKLESDVLPEIINGRLMVPLRAIGDALSAVTKWNPVSHEITLVFNGKYVIVEIGSAIMFYGHGYDSGGILLPETVHTAEIDAPPVIVSGRTLVPLRAIAEGLGAKVTWDESANIANISLSLTEFVVSSVDVVNGFLYFYDEWIYYISFGGDLWRIRPDGSGAMEVTKEGIEDYLNPEIRIIDDWIYFYGNYRNDASTRISRVRTDGSEHQVIATHPYGGLYEIRDIADGWIYYYKSDADGRAVYKIRLNGTDNTYIMDQFAGKMKVAPDGWIYYSIPGESEPRIHKMRTDGTDKTAIGEDWLTNASMGSDATPNFVVDKDWVYFGVENNLDGSVSDYNDYYYIYKLRTDGSEKMTKIVRRSYMPLATADGWLYCYEHSASQGSIYKIRTDGSEKTILEKAWRCNNIMVIDDYIYYSSWTDDGRGVFRIKLGTTKRESLITGKW